MPIYRVRIDENGQDDCRDFTVLEDAYQEFKKARKRGAFSVRVDAFNSYDYTFTQTILKYEKGLDSKD